MRPSILGIVLAAAIAAAAAPAHATGGDDSGARPTRGAVQLALISWTDFLIWAERTRCAKQKKPKRCAKR